MTERAAWRIACHGLIIAVFSVCLRADQTTVAAKKTQWDRVYSVAQAQRGEALFANACVSCHSIDRGARRSPANLPLNDSSFWANWNGMTLDILSQRIRLSMPAVAPGSLSPDEVADLIAFFLELEGAQSGGVDLPSRLSELKAIRLIEPIPPAIAR